ncbi:hypothetical protein GCM10010156_66060 [Planobispora rosea]|uniref:Uncharacterized protein n=1 Tax=Planobispora rosea TaxID=35762 RepID=A0A8J3S8C5_PLARO|nr:hypothetical protein [Planobispora rosea]GGS98718.1 hypothetical protein GCM10010156_66060 [Planobispora rosea]GIH87970.1 hypothetical protein Pro02_63780 [Planobispora rosea]
MTTPSRLPVATMTRLAFIRMLHQHGVDQSHLPSPLNFTCILTFHDAIEMFLMLAGEHLGVPIADKGGFVDRYFGGLHPSKDANGVALDGRNGIKRLTDLRNAFKHANTWPGPDAIEQSRADASGFFEANTPMVFGIAFDAITMSDLVPQEKPRDLLKQAEQCFHDGEHTGGMALLVDAFEELYRAHITSTGRRAPFAFGPNLPSAPREGEFRRAIGEGSPRGAHVVPKVVRELHDVSETVRELQAAMRVLTLGVEYHDYLRFQHLTPTVVYTADGGRHVYPPENYTPTHDDFAYGQRFVVTAALRLAQIQTHLSDALVRMWRTGC